MGVNKSVSCPICGVALGVGGLVEIGRWGWCCSKCDVKIYKGVSLSVGY